MATRQVLLVDGSRLFREALRYLLYSSDFVVSEEAENIAAAIRRVRDGYKPDLILLDLISTQKHELDSVRELRDCLPDGRIAVLSFDVSTSALARSLEAGVDAYLLQDISVEGLIHSLTLAMAGEKVFPSRMAKLLIEGKFQFGSYGEVSSSGGLSTREVEILQCLLNGDSNKVIANHLKITEATVKVHLRSLLKKINADNRTQAAIWALENGFDHYAGHNAEIAFAAE